jgi:phosphoglycolate phosphatase
MSHVFLFDIDGTLILTGGVGMRSLERATVELTGIEGATRGIEADGKTDHLLAAEIAAALGRQIEDFPERLFARYLEHLAVAIAETERYVVLPGVAQALAVLDEHALPYGLATGNLKAAAEIKLARGGLWDRFPFGGFGCDGHERPRLVARAIERSAEHLGRPVAPDTVVVIGDTPRDVHAAHATGARAIGVATGSYSEAKLAAAGADWTLPTLEAFPDWVRRSVQPHAVGAVVDLEPR